jgi:hypothetical protein
MLFKLIFFNLFLFLVLSLNTWAATSTDFPVGVPEPGQCVADVFTKKYLSRVDTHGSFIGPIRFSCTYQCKNSTGVIQKITAIHELRNIAVDEDQVVCFGAVVNSRYINQTLIGEMKEVKTFWPQSSRIPELEKWVASERIELPVLVKQKMVSELLTHLKLVANEYLKIDSITHPEYKEAAHTLLLMSQDNEDGRYLLKSSLIRTSSARIDISLSEKLVDPIVDSLGHFLLFEF